MRTTTQKHKLRWDTVSLAKVLKKIESRPHINRLAQWLADEVRNELSWRAEAARRAIG